MRDGLNEELNVMRKMTDVKQMDLEECVFELNNRYYPVIVRLALEDYIGKLQNELESYHAKLITLQNDVELTP